MTGAAARIAAALAATVLAPSPTVPCAAGLICPGDVASVVAGLHAAGYKGEVRAWPTGKPFIVSAIRGDEFSIEFNYCADEVAARDCTALALAYFLPPQPYLTADFANRYNRDAAIGRAYVDTASRLQFDLVVVADGGLTPAAFKAVLGHFAEASADLDTAVRAAMATPPAGSPARPPPAPPPR